MTLLDWYERSRKDALSVVCLVIIDEAGLAIPILLMRVERDWFCLSSRHKHARTEIPVYRSCYAKGEKPLRRHRPAESYLPICSKYDSNLFLAFDVRTLMLYALSTLSAAFVSADLYPCLKRAELLQM